MSRRVVATLSALAGVTCLSAMHVGSMADLRALGSSVVAAAGPQDARAAAPAGRWSPPRTTDGHPDLRGYWSNDTFMPVERDPELGTKELFTPDEAAAYFKQRLDRLLNQPKTDIHYDDALWQAEVYGKEPQLRTSLIIDPRNGRLPPLTAEGERRARERAAARSRAPSDSAASRSLAERCISWGNVGPPMLPPTYNAHFQILQTREVVALRYEMMHDVRLVHLGDGPEPGPQVRWLAGHSRGQWDGDTLVVRTTNFTNQTNFRGSPQTTRQDLFASDALTVVERFTPVDPDTIRYQFTVRDPQVWTAPWSGEMPLRRWEGPIYEYACHEGNYGLANILSAARAEDARAESR